MNKNKTETPPPPQNIGQNQSQNQNQNPNEQQQGDLFGANNEDNQGNPPEEIFVEQGQENQPEQNLPENPEPANEGQLSEGDLIPPPAERPENPEGNINKAIVNSFTQNRSSVSLRELNWFCTTELFSDKVFKKYLQNLDNNLKQNLRNNFMNSVDTPPNDTVAAKFAVDNNGNLQKVMISKSSGSEEIDNIVLQSIKETFEGEKSPILNEGSLKSDMYLLKVVIKI